MMIIMDFCTIVKNLNLRSVSPCYDHNVAFQEGFLGLSRTTMGNSASIPLDDLCEHYAWSIIRTLLKNLNQ